MLMDRRKSLLPYRIVEKDAVAHVEVGTAEGIHACPRRRRAYHRVEGVVGVGDRGAAKMGIEQITPPPPGDIIAHDAVVGERAMVDGRAGGAIKTQPGTPSCLISNLLVIDWVG